MTVEEGEEATEQWIETLKPPDRDLVRYYQENSYGYPFAVCFRAMRELFNAIVESLSTFRK
jgi:hypothetical protein